MFEAAITQKTKKIWPLLATSDFIKDFYLAGGTGLALQLGHRLSLDKEATFAENVKKMFLA